MRATHAVPLACVVTMCGCATAQVIPLQPNDIRLERGLTYGSSVTVLNFVPFAEAGASASVLRAAKQTCGLETVPTPEDIELEGGPTGVSVFIGAMLSYAFKCPDAGAHTQ